MNKEYYKEYYTLERGHWWFRARLEILEATVDKYLTDRPASILNAGIATGATTTMLERFGKVTSLEYDRDCCAFVREKLGIEVVNASLTELPFADHSFDAICAFDVIEHIEDDALAMREIFRCLKPGGKLFLTVPAYETLWSEHDVVNHHFRRYTRPDFVELQRFAGFSIRYATYFNSLLFPPIAAVRVAGRLLKGRATAVEGEVAQSDFARFTTDGFSNRLLYRLFRSERRAIGRGWQLPFGVSILTVASKPAAD